MVFDKTREFTYIARYLAKDIHKILRINLLEDSFELIKVETNEMVEEKGYDLTISGWFTHMVEAGMIHEYDIPRFKKFTDLTYLQEYFLNGNNRLTLTYRRNIDDSYEWVSMRLFATSEFSKDNQEILLIVQKDDSLESLEIMTMAKAQFEIMGAIAKTFVTMHAIKLSNDTFIDLAQAATQGEREFHIIPNATELMKNIITQRMDPDHLIRALEFTDLTTIGKRLAGKKQLSCDLLGKNVGWVRCQFLPIQFTEEGEPNVILFTTMDVDEEKHKEEHLSRISTELDLATHIQTAVIPNTFPAFPEKKEFDIYANMTPAKEVGGDFYDFYFVDEDHFAMVIADVSGKGIPAALFMMVSKVIIKNQATNQFSPSKILQKVNVQLCENNDMDMFVTVWIGILEISTGKLTCSNGGHEYPALRRKGKSFELFTDKHSLALGCLPGIRYKDYEIQLEKGDQIFVYTDGVTEATNSDQNLFGTTRMIEALNKNPDGTIEQKVEIMCHSIQDFVQDGEQFDDITMMILQYNGVA
ncbi:MAG: PP2C family protein-serine/threonine phosphatase [Bacillota bacterium]|nr:PP2C family protein-serine/threonine phosphatase [Bacillota bacterium]